MKIKLEEVVLKALASSGTEVSVADIIRRAQLTMTKGNVSSRLCELRTKGFATSYQQDGVNYWSLTSKGLAALSGDIPADIPAHEVVQESPENQPIDGDISADISAASPDVLASEMLAEAECGCRACLPTLPTLAFDSVVSPVLIEEARRLRPVRLFPKLDDALFVLDIICTTYCQDLPAYQDEIGRIAEHLKATAV